MKADWLPLHKFWKQNELRAGTANSQVLGLFFFLTAAVKLKTQLEYLPKQLWIILAKMLILNFRIKASKHK